jgi:hypothetical protein
MMKNKLLLIFLFTILLSGVVFSDPDIKIDGLDFKYTNNISQEFSLQVILSEGCNLGESIQVDVSTEYSDVDFSVDVSCNSSGEYKKTFFVNTLENDPDTPNILVNKFAEGHDYEGYIYDIVRFDYLTEFSRLYINDTPVTIGTFDVNSIDFTYNDFYKDRINLFNATNYGIGYTSGFENYYIYFVESSNLFNFKNDYSERIIVDSLDIFEEIIDTTLLDDGNYYVLLDYEDKAGNFGEEEYVISSSVYLKIDNSEPEITSFNLGSVNYFETENTFYLNSDVNHLNIQFEDKGVGIDSDGFTFLERNDEILVDVNISEDIGIFDFDFSDSFLTIGGSYSLSIEDFLGNVYEKDFNIIIDSNAPTIPTIPTLTRAIDNNITIASWGTSTDAASGLKEYRVYRSTSSFTTITNQTLICTVLSSATKSCVDSSSKSDNTRYYYGVSAVDNAGNKSAVVPENIKTGPSLSIDVVTDYSNYTNKTTPKIDLEYSSDVNAVRFSCNASTFTSWISVSGTSTSYESFNITSGNGCSTTQGDKTIYVEARSEDDPYPITRKSKNINYDSQAPTVPSNVSATQQTNGSIKISWNASTDTDGSGIKEYRVYYSELDNVTTASLFFVTTNTEYNFRPNIDQKFYFKVSSIDRVGNQSALSSGVFQDAKRFGPSFTFNVNPKNVIDDVYYLKKGIANFTITSSQTLKQTPTIKLKVANNPFQTIVSDFSNLNATFSYDFQENGVGIIEVTGINNLNETSTDIFEFIIDVNAPDFDVNLNFNQDTNEFNFVLDDYSEDIFRAQYFLNNNEEICFIEDSNNNYECVLDSNNYPDGDYKMHVVVYDIALNFTTKIIDFEIDNVDEQALLRDNLIREVNENKIKIENRINFLNSISIDISDDILTDFQLGKERLAQAVVFEDNNNFAEAINSYTYANNLFLEILNLLPKENILKTRTITINLKNNNYNLNEIILDQNILSDNLLFYDVNNLDLEDIVIKREFSVFEISGQNYYSSTLSFENNSDDDKIISYVEFIPKEFSRSASKIFFDKNVIVIDDDPIILYNLVLSKNSSFSTRYINKEPITSFDILTKYDSIFYDDPLLLTGFINKEDLDLSKPLFNTKFLFTISVIFLVIIIILLVIWVIISSHKKKKEVFTNLGAKDSMNKYFGSKSEGNTLEKVKDANSTEKSDIEKKNDFDSNYDFILNAVKRNNK